MKTDDDLVVIPPAAQIQVVNRIVLPLLERTGIQVTITTTPEGMTLGLVFNKDQPDETPQENTIGTYTPEQAQTLWALRDQIERARHADKSSAPV